MLLVLFIYFIYLFIFMLLLCKFVSTLNKVLIIITTMVEINYWTNGKIDAKVAFPRYTESVKFRSQSRETATKRKPYRGLGTR